MTRTILDDHQVFEHLPYMFSYWIKDQKRFAKTKRHPEYKCKKLYKGKECLWHA